MKKKSIIMIMAAVTLCSGCNFEERIEATVASHPKTFCNPLNLDYRFMLIEGGDGIREASGMHLHR